MKKLKIEIEIGKTDTDESICEMVEQTINKINDNVFSVSSIYFEEIEIFNKNKGFVNKINNN